MSRQIKRLPALGKREAVADQSFQVHFMIHDKANRLFVKVDRGTVGPQQRLLIDTDCGRIDHYLPVLCLRKKQNPATWTGRIHRSTNQGISADRQNHGVGSAPLGQLADALNDIYPRRFYCKV